MGSGPCGYGAPLQVGNFEKTRTLCDGAGLCSLGRWEPQHRPAPQALALQAFSGLIDKIVQELPLRIGKSAEQLFSELAKGSIKESPFSNAMIDGWHREAVRIFENAGIRAAPRNEDRQQLVHIRLVQAVLIAGGDPDTAGLDHFGRGVKLGVDCKLPRTPAVYARKTRWSLAEQESAGDVWDEPVTGVWRDNYKTAAKYKSWVAEQLEEHHTRGLCLRLTQEEAQSSYPNLTVASLGAIEKIADPQRAEDIRLLMDGTYGVGINTRIKVRDQDRCPTASDVKRIQRAQAQGTPPLGLALDVKEAHRLPPVHANDWQYQACRASEDGPVYIYKFGVFGFASSPYWWSRLGGALLRAVHLTASPRAMLWILMMADDIMVESTGEQREAAIVWVIVMLCICGVPFSWHKIQGGTEIKWIGYHLLLTSAQLGITDSRARWAIQWLERVHRDGCIRGDELRSGVGRLAFIAGALEYERPFLAPLYAFLSKLGGSGLVTLPLYVRLVLFYLASRLKLRRHYPSAESGSIAHDGFRVDARATGEEIGIGGWQPLRDERGAIAIDRSPWFACTLNRESAPWAYHKGKPFRAIASLEALATLFGVHCFLPSWRRHTDAHVLQVPSVTDNRGNKFVLSRLQSTKFPLCEVIMEIAAQLEQRQCRLATIWALREINQEADRLSNGDLRGFNPALRIPIDAAALPWLVLNNMMKAGMEFVAERTLPSANLPRKGKYKLREQQPW